MNPELERLLAALAARDNAVPSQFAEADAELERLLQPILARLSPTGRAEFLRALQSRYRADLKASEPHPRCHPLLDSTSPDFADEGISASPAFNAWQTLRLDPRGIIGRAGSHERAGQSGIMIIPVGGPIVFPTRVGIFRLTAQLCCP